MKEKLYYVTLNDERRKLIEQSITYDSVDDMFVKIGKALYKRVKIAERKCSNEAR